MIVVDTNVVAYLLIEGEHTPRAEQVRARDREWQVPHLFLHEWLNVVTLHVREGKLDRDQALRLYRRGLGLVNVHRSDPEPLRVINLHVSSGCASYDCQFAVLAQDLGVGLVTADKELVRAFPGFVEALG